MKAKSRKSGNWSAPRPGRRDTVFFDSVKDIRGLNRTLALSVARQAKTDSVIRVDRNEQQTIPYDKLVIATGGLPVVPPIEGIRLNRVFRLNHPDDAAAIREAVQAGQVKRATIIGGGLLGREVTEALAANGVQVSIVEMMETILPTMLDFEMAAFLTKHVRAKGVQVYTGEKVLRLEANSEGNVGRVVTNQREIETDLVLLAVGARPNTQLAEDAGLALGPPGDCGQRIHANQRPRHLRRRRLRGEPPPGQRAKNSLANGIGGQQAWPGHRR